MVPRLARIRKLTRAHLRSHRLEGTSLFLSYDDAAAAEVEHIVGLERECCPFLDFNLRRAANSVELVILGPEQAGSDAHWLFSQFLPDAPAVEPSQPCACRNG